MLHDWNEVERHAAALEDFVRQEPLPWTEFIVARARIFAAIGRGDRSKRLNDEMQRLRTEGDQLGIRLGLN